MRSKILLLFLLVFSLAFASAAFTLGEPNNTISTNYAIGAYLSGAVNISFDSEPFISTFYNNFGDSITLEEILNTSANSGFAYTCNTDDCESTYSALTPETQKIFTLNAGASKTFGFELTGMITNITSLKFKIDSTAPASCSNQLKIDLFDDGTIETGNTKQSLQTCGQNNYSCYNNSLVPIETTLGAVPFCQKVTLTEAPGFELGAYVQEVTAGNRTISMKLYASSGVLLKSCDLPSISGAGSEVSCKVEHLVTEPADYYVCVVAGEGTGEYKARGQVPTGEKCGFNGFPPQAAQGAYQIFFKKSQFSPIGSITIENEISSGELLSTKIKNYLIQTYHSLDCSNTCLVPLKLTSEENQSITLKDLELKYDQVGFPGVTNYNFYEFSTDPAKVNSDFQKLYFDGSQFTIPQLIGFSNYAIFFSGGSIYAGNFSIKNISIIISPTQIPVTFPTLITAAITAENEIISYYWDFGDGLTQTTLISEVEHVYSEKGEFNLVLEITDAEGTVFSKSEIITVNISKEIIDSKIAGLEAKIASLETQMSSLDQFTKKTLQDYMELNETKTILQEIKANYSSNENDTSFIQTLINLNVPNGFLIVPTSQIAYYPSESIVDLNILETIQGETYDYEKEAEYQEGIVAWFQNNLDAKINMKEVLVDEGNGQTPAFRIFSVDISKKQTLSEDPDVVVRELSGITFSNPAGKQSTNGYIHFKLGSTTKIEFSTTEQIEFIGLPLFISPSLSNLMLPEGPTITGEREKDWRIFAGILLGVLILGVLAYFIIGNWYKRKYEKKLFPNKNNLFNMVTYVNNSKEKGMKNSEIRKNLSKVGWSSEQINYVMKKHAGKNTGLPGINANKQPN